MFSLVALYSTQLFVSNICYIGHIIWTHKVQLVTWTVEHPVILGDDMLMHRFQTVI